MFLYYIIPLTKIPRPAPQTPAYFSTERFEVGQLMSVPLAHRKIAAVIYKRQDASQQKQDIKRASYALKNISGALVSHPIFTKEFLDLAQNLANYYYTSTGLMLQRMLPSEFSKPSIAVLTMLEKLPVPKIANLKETPEKILIIAKNRLKLYKNLIKKEPFLYIAPEYAYLAAAQTALGGQLLKKNLTMLAWRNVWRDAYWGSNAGLVGTRTALFVPHMNTRTLIIDGENNTSHKSWDQHPKFDARYAAEYVAKLYNAQLIVGDVIPSIQTWWLAKSKNWKIIKENYKVAPVEIIDMRAELAHGNSSVFSQKLQQQLKDAAPNAKILLYINRRGLSSALVCRDCGYVEKCPRCDTSFVLHSNYHKNLQKGYELPGANNKLFCHHCGAHEYAPSVCKQCGGNRIKLLGGGTQRVVEEVRRIAPHLKVVRLDSDVSATAESVLANFTKGKFNVLVGTRLALKEPLWPKWDICAVVMLDLVLNLPTYQASEQVFETIWRLKAQTKKQVFVQTYLADLPLFKYAREDTFEPFFTDELRKRQALNYPPFSQLIRLTYSHKNAERAEQEARITKQKMEVQLKNLQSNYSLPATSYPLILGPAPAFVAKVADKYIWYILIKWLKNQGVEDVNIQLRNRLLSVVSKGWDIDIDPLDIV